MNSNIHFEQNRITDFCQRWNVEELAVFGSVARGDFRDDSDIDVMVTFTAKAHIGLLSLARMENELSDIFHRKVDLVTKGGLKPIIRDEILAEAGVLYAA